MKAFNGPLEFLLAFARRFEPCHEAWGLLESFHCIFYSHDLMKCRSWQQFTFECYFKTPVFVDVPVLAKLVLGRHSSSHRRM